MDKINVQINNPLSTLYLKILELCSSIEITGICILFFKNMPTKLNQVPLVEFGFHRKQDKFKIQFRDVPIGG
jgi:hypothetical protein